MSELESDQDGQVAKGGMPGAALKRAREAQGLSIGDVSVKLNLTDTAVKNLEADRYGELPGVAFTRGYIRSYAKLLGLDGDQLASQYVQTTRDIEVKPLPSLEPAPLASRSRKRYVLAGGALVAALISIAVAYWWQEERGQGKTLEPETPFAQVEVERADGTLHIQSLDENQLPPVNLSIADTALDAMNESAQNDQPGVDEPGTTLMPDEALAAIPALPAQGHDGVEAVTSAAQAEATVAVDAAPGDSVLELSFTQECWIRVTDAQGREINSGLKKAGENLSLTGKAPFNVHLGNAKGVELKLNGKQVDLKQSIRGNIARLKLG